MPEIPTNCSICDSRSIDSDGDCQNCGAWTCRGCSRMNNSEAVFCHGCDMTTCRGCSSLVQEYPCIHCTVDRCSDCGSYFRGGVCTGCGSFRCDHCKGFSKRYPCRHCGGGHKEVDEASLIRANIIEKDKIEAQHWRASRPIVVQEESEEEERHPNRFSIGESVGPVDRPGTTWEVLEEDAFVDEDSGYKQFSYIIENKSTGERISRTSADLRWVGEEYTDPTKKDDNLDAEGFTILKVGDLVKIVGGRESYVHLAGEMTALYHTIAKVSRVWFSDRTARRKQQVSLVEITGQTYDEIALPLSRWSWQRDWVRKLKPREVEALGEVAIAAPITDTDPFEETGDNEATNEDDE